MLEVVAGLEDDLDSAMLVAHDPGMSELARQLSPQIERMPTCAVALVTFPVASWREVPAAEPDSIRLFVPGERTFSPLG
jgi:phosphohistidine phosphatase